MKRNAAPKFERHFWIMVALVSALLFILVLLAGHWGI